MKGRFCLLLVAGMLVTAGGTFAAPSPLANASPVTLISQGRQLAREARTLSADMIVVYEGGDHVTASVRLMKPNYVRITMQSASSMPRLACDGEWSYATLNGTYRREAAGSADDPLRVLVDVFPPLATFLNPDLLTASEPTRTGVPFGVATGSGREEYVGVETGQAKEGVAAWYFNERGLAAGARLNGTGIKSVWLQNVALDVPMQRKEFLYRVPTGFQPVGLTRDGCSLLPVGTAAPELSLSGAEGMRLQLSDLRKEHEFTLVQFWSYASPQARSALAQAEALHKEMRGAGLAVVGVNVGDPEEAVLRLKRELGLTFPMVGGRGAEVEEAAQSYAVTDGSGSYLIDREGRILWRGEKLDPEAAQALTRTIQAARSAR